MIPPKAIAWLTCTTPCSIFRAARLFVPDKVRSPAPVFTSKPLPDSVPDRRRLWRKPRLNVALPPNAIALEIESDSVPDVKTVVVTVARSRSARGGVVPDLARVKFDVGLATVLANRIESTRTAPGPKLLVPVILSTVPLNTSENVSVVFSGVLQLLAAVQLLLVPLPNQVVTVPADAVLAAAMHKRVVARNLLLRLMCMEEKM